MKPTTGLSLAAAAMLGLAAPVAAQQGMTGGHDGMMGGMMGGQNSYAMRMFDTNKDGTLAPEEMTAGMEAELTTYDSDKNGSLSLTEFEAMYAAHTRTMMVRAFQMHDEDGDGQVTKAEMATMAEMMQQRMAEPQMHGAEKGGMSDEN